MSGINSLISDTTSQATTMPAWFDQAQQNTVNQALSAAGQVPSFQNTAGGVAVSNLTGAANPFTQAQNTLSSIAQTAATSPWITNPATGAVTPNTATPLGGLFQANQQQLNQLIPQTVAPSDAASISGGQFGSLRNKTAADTALANAQAQMLPGEYQAALANQQTGINAATGLSGVGAQGTAAETTLGQAQQNAPFTGTKNLAQVLGSTQVPTTTTQSASLSPLTQLQTLGNYLGMTPGQLAGAAGNAATSILGSIFGTNTPSTGAVSAITNTATQGQPGYGWQYFSDGTSISPTGQYYQGGTLIYDPSQYGGGTSGNMSVNPNPGSDPGIGGNTGIPGTDPFGGTIIS
jgi:hypothetical protein